MPNRKNKRCKRSPNPVILSTKSDLSNNSVGQKDTGPVFHVPPELWFEILSYFPVIPIPTLRISESPLLPPSTLARQDTLRALSQTCRTFRNQFLAQLWERLEVCAIREQAKNPQGQHPGLLSLHFLQWVTSITPVG